MSTENVDMFKSELRKLNWDDVCSDQDVDSAYNKFWNKFETLFELSFPLTRIRFNRNHHRVNDYMTAGLLVSRKNKLNLHKKSITEPSETNLSRYKTYRNLYNKLIRASKKMYFDYKFRKNRKNPKQTWSLINEALGTTKNSEKISKISVNGVTITSDQEIANEFNNFFGRVGKEISESVSRTSTKPEKYLLPNNAPDIELYELSPDSVINLIKLFTPKSSTDIDGISLKLLKSDRKSTRLNSSHSSVSRMPSSA